MAGLENISALSRIQSPDPTNFDRWRDDLLLRESQVREKKTRRTTGAAQLSESARGFLQKGLGLSPEMFCCLQNAAQGTPCKRCPCRLADVLNGQHLLVIHNGPDGRQPCTLTFAGKTVYAAATGAVNSLKG